MTAESQETKFLVRMPASLHAALREAAEREHVSMNDLVVVALADRVERRARFQTLLARSKAKHAEVLARLADR